ncbi:MAG: AbrB/MazE/SpoVT family DNA-binding domain-containing protein [Acidobacteriota bacterium]|nr:AbrB/MazE/SpoVT family DNA-binding domain-containing protein [Acidobacteriota bacterium]
MITTASTVTSKGQITVPKRVRERLGLKAGDSLEFVTDGDRTFVRPLRNRENPFLKLRGMIKGAFKNQEEINAWVADMRSED